jgi:hypothetical protein
MDVHEYLKLERLANVLVATSNDLRIAAKAHGDAIGAARLAAAADAAQDAALKTFGVSNGVARDAEMVSLLLNKFHRSAA